MFVIIVIIMDWKALFDHINSISLDNQKNFCIVKVFEFGIEFYYNFSIYFWFQQFIFFIELYIFGYARHHRFNIFHLIFCCCLFICVARTVVTDPQLGNNFPSVCDVSEEHFYLLPTQIPAATSNGSLILSSYCLISNVVRTQTPTH